jgi:hypothetical protein
MTQQVCPRCDRPISDENKKCRTHRPIVSVHYAHSGYGCDSGCCGHQVYGIDDAGDQVQLEWMFSHDRDDIEEVARAFADKLHVPVGACEYSDD